MIVIGADTHKATHALVAVDAGSGQVLSEREIPADEAGHLQALRWAHELDSELIWAIRGLPTRIGPPRASANDSRRASASRPTQANGRLAPGRARGRQV